MNDRLTRLRKEMLDKKIDAYIIPTDDFHSSEYVCDYFKCRAYISGFTGSAGTLLVLADEAFLWTDGRYFLQAASQLENSDVVLMKMGEAGVPNIKEYLVDILAEGAVIGFDGRCVDESFYEELSSMFAIKKKNVSFVTKYDLVDAVWDNRPSMPCNPVFELDSIYTGQTRIERIALLREEMKNKGADVHVLSSLDDICWLYLIRGADVMYNPVPLCYTIINIDNAVLYININSLDASIIESLSKDGITVKEYNSFYDDLREVGTRVLINKKTANTAMVKDLEEAGAVLIDDVNPTTIFKAIKTSEEIKNERVAHIKDAIAVTKLLYYIKEVMPNSVEFTEGKVTELSLADKLDGFRKKQSDYLYQSFAPIIASGEHGAIIHYDPTPETDIPIQNNTFLLMDTGGQYYQGTTDITRTISVGEVDFEMKRNYTLVLKGHLALAMAVFKEGTCGQNLDVLARGPLNRYGLDYNHGTGHGVGYLLNVHEGPQNIRFRLSDVPPYPMKPGMITSDEPGVYLAGKYGIRTENLMVCNEVNSNECGKFYGFEFLTLVPYDRDCILPELLSNDEIQFLNSYHKKVYETIGNSLDKEEKSWLLDVTKPL